MEPSHSPNGVSQNGQAMPIDTALRARTPMNTALLVDGIVYGVAFVGAAIVALYGAGYIGRAGGDTVLMVAGLVCMIMTAVLWPILRRLHIARAAGTNDAQTVQKLENLTEAIRVLTDHASLSTDARRVLNRRAEKDLLCRAIEEDVNAEDWDAAMVLCRELADRFGYRAEAEEFRARIDSRRGEAVDRRVSDAIARLDGLIIQRRWDVALREAMRIQRTFPDSHRVETLRQRVEQARAVYKADLEHRFLDAAQHQGLGRRRRPQRGHRQQRGQQPDANRIRAPHSVVSHRSAPWIGRIDCSAWRADGGPVGVKFA